MALQSAKEGERVAILREELESQLESTQKEHQDKIESIVE
jgi:predicted DNA-binding antitoxin AbrB/MazE fold protein